MREHYASNYGGHHLISVLGLASKQEGICYHTLLVGGRDGKMLLKSISSSVVSGFWPTSDTTVGKLVTPGTLWMYVIAKAKGMLIKYCYLRSQWYGFYKLSLWPCSWKDIKMLWIWWLKFSFIGRRFKALSPESQMPEYGHGCLGFLWGKHHRLPKEAKAAAAHFIPYLAWSYI